MTDVAPTASRSGILTGMLQEEVAQRSGRRRAGVAAMPPGPPLPRLLQTLGFIFAPAPFLDACRRRYGDVVTMGTLFDSKFVMVFDPDLVKQVFRGPPEQLRAGEANAPLGPVLGQRSVLLLDGAEHLRQRRLMLPAFHGERMREYEQVMTRRRRPRDRLVAGRRDRSRCCRRCSR